MSSKTAKFCRAKLVSTLQCAFINELYKKKGEEKLKLMANLAIKNDLLRGTCYKRFMFNGKWYSTTPEEQITTSPKETRNLHPSLLPEACAIVMTEDFEEAVERNHITHFFGSILSTCKHEDDLYTFIPGELHHVLTQMDMFDYTIGSPMDDIGIASLRKKIAVSVLSVERYYMKKLLLQE